MGAILTERAIDLDELMGAVSEASRLSPGDARITGITCDSREIAAGGLMVCVSGTQSDGHMFAGEAVQRGAAALVVERHIPQTGVLPTFRVPDARLALALLSDRFFGHPSGELDLVGVTGTDGKTTIVNLAGMIAREAGWDPGLIGTLGIRQGDRTSAVPNTTPGADRFQKTLRSMADAGSRCVLSEVSSHALDMHRVAGAEFRVVLLSNLTRDHLDWHGSEEKYRAAKAKLFQRAAWLVDPAVASDRDTLALLPSGDPAADWIAERANLRVARYGFDRDADWRLSEPRLRANLSRARFEGPELDIGIEIPLPGRFNLLNAAAAAAACRWLGAAPETIQNALRRPFQIPGRMQRVDHGQPFGIIVDYAHTPGSLRALLTAVREFTSGRIICVIGCGGERDRGKRPEMASVAAELSDVVVLTSDNPRSEDPERILDEMEAGLKDRTVAWKRIADRARAVADAVGGGDAGDTVVIAGKGHERYQDVGGERRPCDDTVLAATALKARGFNPEEDKTETEG